MSEQEKSEIICAARDNDLQVITQSQPDRLLEIAIEKGADLEQLDKLLQLKERFDNEISRKSFTAALSAFKSEDICIKKDKTVVIDKNDGGQYSYNHASLGNVVALSVKLMSKHGLSHRWEIKQGDARVKVTCILTHKDGHSEETTLEASPDSSGSKNGIQQVSSTITYLQRYTFLSITGLAVEEMDDDGTVFQDQNKKQVKKQKLEVNTRNWENAKKAYIRDGNLDRVKMSVDVSHELELALISECENAVS